MRSEGTTGTVLITLACLLLLWQPAAAGQDGDSISLIGDASGPQDRQTMDLEEGDTGPAEDGSGDEHPVYHLRLEPFSDESALTLGLDELLALAVEHNLGLARQHYNIEKGHYSVDQTYYAFDPTVSGSLSYANNTASMAGGALGSSSSYSSASISYAVPREYGDSFEFSYSAGSSGGPTEDEGVGRGVVDHCQPGRGNVRLPAERQHHLLKEDVLAWLQVSEMGRPGHYGWTNCPLYYYETDDKHQY